MAVISQGTTRGWEAAALRALVDLRDLQLQKARIQFGNRLRAISAGEDAAVHEQREIVARYYRAFDELERLVTRDIEVLVRRYPIYHEVARVRGVGPTLAAKTVALIGDIGRFDTVSKLWRFAGYAVVEGKAERRRAGEKAHYCGRLKVTCYLLGTSFLRLGSPYREVYDRAKERYAQTHPEWTPLHRHRAAQRVMVKIFLSHLWERWRLLEGLPVRNHYAADYLGHPTTLRPEQFGWGRAGGNGNGNDSLELELECEPGNQ